MPPPGLSQEDTYTCAARPVSHKHFLATWHWLLAGLNFGSPLTIFLGFINIFFNKTMDQQIISCMLKISMNPSRGSIYILLGFLNDNDAYDA